MTPERKAAEEIVYILNGCPIIGNNLELEIEAVEALIARHLAPEREKIKGHLQMIEAMLCDKELCGHFTAEEIRAEARAALEGLGR